MELVGPSAGAAQSYCGFMAVFVCFLQILRKLGVRARLLGSTMLLSTFVAARSTPRFTLPLHDNSSYIILNEWSQDVSVFISSVSEWSGCNLRALRSWPPSSRGCSYLHHDFECFKADKKVEMARIDVQV